jgi:hypothetical protein
VILTLIKYVADAMRKKRKIVHLEKLNLLFREVVVVVTEKEIKSFSRMKMKMMSVIKILQVVSLD